MNTIQNILIAVLAIVVGYLFVSHTKSTELLRNDILLLKEDLSKMNDKIETQIAYSKAFRSEQNSASSPDQVASAFRNVFRNISRQHIKSPEEVLNEMVTDLGLSEAQGKSIKKVLDVLQEKKQEVLKNIKETGNLFDSHNREIMDTARENAHKKIKALLSEEQYSMMKVKGYDKKLRITLPEQ